MRSVSCTSAGSCGAGGSYRDGSHHSQSFVTGEPAPAPPPPTTTTTTTTVPPIAPAAPQLACTGSHVSLLVEMALSMIGLGAVVVAVGRRQQRAQR